MKMVEVRRLLQTSAYRVVLDRQLMQHGAPADQILELVLVLEAEEGLVTVTWRDL